MATLVATTVDPGGTGDYLTLNAANADQFGGTSFNFVANDEYAVCSCICTNGAADTVYPEIFGDTCDATRNVTVQVPLQYRHLGVYPTSGNIYRIDVALGAGTHAIYMGTDFMVYDGLALRVAVDSNNHSCCKGSSAEAMTVKNSLGALTGGAGKSNINGFVYTSCTGTNLYYNNICYTCEGGPGFHFKELTGTCLMYNNTAHNCNTGFFLQFGTVYIKNNLGFANTVEDYNPSAFSFHADSTNNGYTNGLTNPDTLGASNSIDLGADGAAIFTNYAGKDMTLKDETSPAFGVGADLRADALQAITTDFYDVTRVATPCIGADEYLYTANGNGNMFGTASDGARRRRVKKIFIDKRLRR